MSHQAPVLINPENIINIDVDVQPMDVITVDISITIRQIHIQIRKNNVLTLCYEFNYDVDGVFRTAIFDLEDDVVYYSR